jgi:hypothetical protein
MVACGLKAGIELDDLVWSHIGGWRWSWFKAGHPQPGRKAVARKYKGCAFGRTGRNVQFSKAERR